MNLRMICNLVLWYAIGFGSQWAAGATPRESVGAGIAALLASGTGLMQQKTGLGKEKKIEVP